MPMSVKWLQAAHIKRWWAVRKKEIQMKSILIQTYLVALPIVLGYIVWLLKQQKKSRDANSKGTMLLLRVQLIEYHQSTPESEKYRHMPIRTSVRCMMRIMR